MKTFVSIAQQMLNGEITMDEAAEEMAKLNPAKEHYDYDGVSYEGEQRNTISAMMALSIDSEAGKVDRQVANKINELIDKAIEKKKHNSQCSYD